MGVAWFRSRWIRIAGAAALLLAIAVIVAPVLIPMDGYRQLLVTAIESETGRHVRIDRLQISLLPKLRLHVTNVRVENPAGFPAGDTLVARSIDLGIAPRPLLARQLHITYIAPDGVQLNVLRDAKGRTNIGFSATTNGPRDTAGGVLTLERIGAIDVKDADVTFADLPGNGQPSFELTGASGQIRSIDPQTTDWPKRLIVSADLGGARLTTPLLAQPLVFHTGTFSFKNGTGRGAFSLALAGAGLSGTAAFARIDPLSITFALDSPELDLEKLAALVRPGSQTGLTSSASRRVLATGTIAIEKVAFAPFATTHNSAHVQLSTSAVRLDRYSFSTCGGTVRGTALFDGSTSGVRTSGTADARGIDVEQMLAALGFGTGKVTGTAQAELRFATTLAHDPEQALTATGTFAVRNGAFPSIDVKGKLADVARIVSLNVPSGETSFGYFGGDLRIANERAYSNNLRLIASGVQATSRGSFGLDGTLSYAGTGIVDTLAPGQSAGSPAVVASVRLVLNNVVQRTLGATSVKVPFSLRGTLDNPQFALGGTPQVVTTSGAQPSGPAFPSVRKLLKSIPGLPPLPL